VADYNADAGTVHVQVSKSGKPRHVVLTDEGRKFFDGVVAGKIAGALAFAKADGSRWGASHQQRPFKVACEGAKVGALTFHELRHAYAWRQRWRSASGWLFPRGAQRAAGRDWPDLSARGAVVR
jgi:integrase